MQGIRETREDRVRDRARADLADVYETHDMRKDSHWSEKARAGMTERDWRIFREDYSISYKGAALGATALPLRNWEEGNLPTPLMRAIERQVCAGCSVGSWVGRRFCPVLVWLLARAEGAGV